MKRGSKLAIVVLVFLFPVSMFISSLVRAMAIKKTLEGDDKDKSILALAWDLFTRKFRY